MRAHAIACAAIAAAICFPVLGCGGGSSEPSSRQTRAAVAEAKQLYQVAKAFSGVDLARGPCIGNPMPRLGGDWVADIAHDPRRPVDEQPANQCSLYREGRAHHFVELDPSGKLIRTQ